MSTSTCSKAKAQLPRVGQFPSRIELRLVHLVTYFNTVSALGRIVTRSRLIAQRPLRARAIHSKVLRSWTMRTSEGRSAVARSIPPHAESNPRIAFPNAPLRVELRNTTFDPAALGIAAEAKQRRLVCGSRYGANPSNDSAERGVTRPKPSKAPGHGRSDRASTSVTSTPKCARSVTCHEGGRDSAGSAVMYAAIASRRRGAQRVSIRMDHKSAVGQPSARLSVYRRGRGIYLPIVGLDPLHRLIGTK